MGPWGQGDQPSQSIPLCLWPLGAYRFRGMLLPENLSSSGGLLMRVHSGRGRVVGPSNKTKGLWHWGHCGAARALWAGGVGEGHVAGGTGEYRVGGPLTSRLRQCQQRWPQTETRPRPQGVKAPGQLRTDSASRPCPTNMPSRSKSSPMDKKKLQDPAMQSPLMLLCGGSLTNYQNLHPTEEEPEGQRNSISGVTLLINGKSSI